MKAAHSSSSHSCASKDACIAAPAHLAAGSCTSLSTQRNCLNNLQVASRTLIMLGGSLLNSAGNAKQISKELCSCFSPALGTTSF